MTNKPTSQQANKPTSHYTVEDRTRQDLLSEIAYLNQQLAQLKSAEESLKGRYGLHFERKPETCESILDTKIPLFKADASLDIIPTSLNQTNPPRPHLLVEGENLHVLMALQQTHKEAIDLIYIDPPYNTGNKDFTYNDKFVDKEDGYRHSKWLSFMEKRLKLAKELLKDTGVVFISIDENEQANLKLLCDQIFGENNHLGTLIQNKGNAQNDAKNIQKNHEYIIVFTKSKQYLGGKEIEVLSNISNEKIKVFKKQDGSFYIKGSSIVTGGEGGTLNSRPNLGYSIYLNPVTSEFIACVDYDLMLAKTINDEAAVYTPNQDLISKGYVKIIRPPRKGKKLGRWTLGLDTFNAQKSNIQISASNSIYKISTVDASCVFEEDGVLYTRIVKESNSKSILDFSSAAGTSVLNDIFQDKIFNNPKNLDMIKYFIKLLPVKQFIILDFFGGSGTTLHATMALNAEDGGSRQCILATNNEGTFEDPVNPGSNLPGGIFDNVTYPRIKKVSLGYTNNKGVSVDGLQQPVKIYKVSEAAGSFAHKDLPVDTLIKRALDTLFIKEDFYTHENVSKLFLTKGEKSFDVFKNVSQQHEKFMVVSYSDLNDEAIEKTLNKILISSNDAFIVVYTPKELDDDTYLETKFAGKQNVEFRDMPDVIKNAFRTALAVKKED